ncbi:MULTISPECIES: hypothetical protein [unclassified Ensifer]|nr:MULTISPECIES: hypothetical protein [unclassified Ensifer]
MSSHRRQLVDGGWDGEAEWLEGYLGPESARADPDFLAIVERQQQATAE